jgi:peptide/nickel transport system permease protein
LLIISIVIFVLMNVVPGDPVAALIDTKSGTFDPKVLEEIKKNWGLDQPLHVQYGRWLGNLLQGDLGRSYRSRDIVSRMVIERLPATFKLAVAAMAYAIIVGVGTGIIAAVRRNTTWDLSSMVLALLGVSMPTFALGLLLMLFFGVYLQWLPVSGYGRWDHLILPALTLGAAVTAIIARVTRSAMLGVLSQDYIRTARAKGIAERMIVYRHALKNALIPVLTIVGVQTGHLLAGAVVTETVFNWPGVGRLMINSIFQRDLPVVQGVVLLFALTFTLVNLAVDLLYASVDPRIRYN